jgi:integrase
VAQLTKQFLEDPETTVLRYYASLAQLLAWWSNNYGGERVLRFNVLKIRDARDRLRKGRAPATVNRYLSAMRSAWNWARTAGLIPQDLLWPSRIMLTEPRGRTRFLSDVELTLLLKAAREHSPVMYAAVLVSVGCGVRLSELLRMRWADVDLEKQRLRVLLSKNNESRGVYLPASAVAAIRILKQAPVVGTHLITDEQGQALNKDQVAGRWNTIRAATGLVDFKWHDLRHSCASFLAQEGANLLEIGAVLGHKSPSVTRRYSHLIEGAPVTGHTKLDEKLREKGS